MSKRGMPWLQFYPADWLSDSVAGCSLAAQGLWFRMLFVAHASQHYGYLEIDGKAIPDELLFRRCGCATVEEYRALLAELFSAGVPSRTASGVIYSRRMVRDQKDRDSAADRQRRHRSHAPVTPMSQEEVISQKSEVRSQKTPSCASAPDAALECEAKNAAFDVFWERWPKKEAKGAGQRAWMKIPIAEYPAIMDGLKRWLVSDQWKRGVIPHPATWLNGKRWQDEDIPQSGENDGNESFAERNQRKSQETLARVRRNLDAMDDKVDKLLPEPHREGPGDCGVSGSTSGSEAARTRKWLS
jgi:hypothetical protein